MGGPAPFYRMQDMAAAQADPVQYDQQAVGPPAPPQQPQPAPQGPPPPAAPPGPPPGAQFPSPAFGGGAPPSPPMGTVFPPNMGPQPPMPTMGQLQTAQRPPDFSQYVRQAEATYAPYMMPKFLQPPAVSQMADIFTMGGASRGAAAYAAHYNVLADQKNNALRIKALGDARLMMNADIEHQMAQERLRLETHTAARADAMYGLDVSRLNLDKLKFIAEEGERQLTDKLHQIEYENALRNQSAYGSLDHPPTPTEQAAAGDQGLKYVPHPGAPGHFRLVPGSTQPPTTEPPSTTDTQTSNVTPSSASTTTTPTTPTPSTTSSTLLTSQGLAQRVEQQKIDAQKATQTAQLGPRLDRVYNEFANLRQSIPKVLPTLGESPLESTVKGAVGGRVALWQATKSHDPQVRAAANSMRNSARLAFSLIFGEAGGTQGIRATMPAIDTFLGPLKDIIKGATTQEEAQSTLDDMERYLRENDPRTQGSTTTTTTTLPGDTGQPTRGSLNALLGQYNH